MAIGIDSIALHHGDAREPGRRGDALTRDIASADVNLDTRQPQVIQCTAGDGAHRLCRISAARRRRANPVSDLAARRVDEARMQSAGADECAAAAVPDEEAAIVPALEPRPGLRQVLSGFLEGGDVVGPRQPEAQIGKRFADRRVDFARGVRVGFTNSEARGVERNRKSQAVALMEGLGFAPSAGAAARLVRPIEWTRRAGEARRAPLHTAGAATARAAGQNRQAPTPRQAR